MPPAKKAIIFDLWGTLVDSGSSSLRDVKIILRNRDDFGVYVQKLEKVFMTKKTESLEEGFREVCKAFDCPDKPFIIERLVGVWNKAWLLSKKYEETDEILEELKGKYKLILVSNTDSISGNKAIEKHDLAKYFDVIKLSADEGKLKEEMFKDVIKELKLKPENVTVVGDSMESDIHGAKNAGVRGILVDRRSKREYEDKILTLKELKEKLEA